MQHLTDYYILYLLLICRIFLKYGTGNVMNNSYLGKLTKEQLSEIDDYLKISLGMHIPETVEAP